MMMKAITAATTNPPTNRPPPAAGESEVAVLVSQLRQTLVAVTDIPLTDMENGACLTSLSTISEAVSDPSSFE